MHPSSPGFSGDLLEGTFEFSDESFKFLSTGINFLLNENLNAAYNKYANELLETFVKHLKY
jgi:hypothetical protein